MRLATWPTPSLKPGWRSKSPLDRGRPQRHRVGVDQPQVLARRDGELAAAAGEGRGLLVDAADEVGNEARDVADAELEAGVAVEEPARSRAATATPCRCRSASGARSARR